MARKETFYQRPLDRTPYQACVWVGVILAVVGIVATVSLWKAAAYFKRHAKLPSVQHAQKINTDKTLNDIQQQVQDQIDQKKKQVADAAKKAAEDAVKQEVQNQKDQLLKP